MQDRIFELTNLGSITAESPTRNESINMQIIYYMSRRNNRATQTQIVDRFGLDNYAFRSAMRDLKNLKMVVEI